MSVPVLDLTRLRSRGAAERAAALEELRHACHTLGFLYIRGEGVPSAACDGAFAASAAFFVLPLIAKMALHSARSPAFRGYTPLGAENTGGSPDWREQIEIGREDAAPTDPKALPPYLRLRGPNQWPRPRDCDALRPAAEALLRELSALSEALLSDLGDALQLPRGALRACLGEQPDTTLKLVRYPPRAGPDGAWHAAVLHAKC
jgi:isopenicillin N synthase-like dioxygenase